MECLTAIWTVEKTRKKRKVHETLSNKSISPNTRYLRYRQHVQFRCIRRGIPLPPGESPDTFREHLTLDHLYIFEHENGPMLDRANKDTPRFIGCLCLHDGTTFIHPHDDDFQQIYMQRTAVSNAWDVLDDGTPYWVDAHALRMTRRLSKRVCKK
jgi:hypothetical protein